MATAPTLDRASDEHADFADMRRRIKAIFIGSVGNLVEWYDFYAYAAFTLYFAGAFFPNSDPVVQQLNAALLFAGCWFSFSPPDTPPGAWSFFFSSFLFYVLRLADDRGDADLRIDRNFC